MLVLLHTNSKQTLNLVCNIVKMVLTKAEQGQLNELKDQYSELKKLIEDVGESVKGISSQLLLMNSELTTRIDGVSSDMQRLEASLNADVQTLKQENEEIRKVVNENVDAVTNDVGKLRAALDQCVKSKNTELDAANSLIATLSTKIVRLEKQCHRGLQHGRGWNVEIDGIPQEVGDEPNDLKLAFSELCTVFRIGVEIDEIEAIHRLPSKQTPKPVIVRFYSRDSVKELHQKKSRLRNIADRLNELDIAGLDEETRIFIRASQCSYYSMLSYNCRVLKRNKLISDVSVGDDGRVSMKLDNGTFVKVDHESTLTQYFPNFEAFSFKYGE